MKLLAAAAAVCVIASAVALQAQRGGAGGGRGRGAPATPREAAPIDLTGYWVSVISEDWKFRMVTPKKGVYDSLTLNAEGRRVADTWDPARDEAAGEQCKAYGAANIMRVPGRLHITWQDDNTLRVDTDAGTQTRLFRLGAAPAAAAAPEGPGSPGSPGSNVAPVAAEGPGRPVSNIATWQGQSIGQWEYAPPGRGSPRLGNLRVVTTNMRPGYVRKNGAPYSAMTMVIEYYDVNTAPNGDRWLTVTTKVEDPVYFTRPYLTSSDFKKLPDASGWNPTPCSAR